MQPGHRGESVAEQEESLGQKFWPPEASKTAKPHPFGQHWKGPAL